MSNAQAPEVSGIRIQPENLRVRAISLAITAEDFKKSLAWYRDVLGFHVEMVYPSGNGAMIVAGEARISLNQDDGKKGTRTKAQGFRIYLNTAQDVDQVAARIKDAGGKIDNEPSDKPWGVRSFDVTDPDGFGLTVQEPLKKA